MYDTVVSPLHMKTKPGHVKNDKLSVISQMKWIWHVSIQWYAIFDTIHEKLINHLKIVLITNVKAFPRVVYNYFESVKVKSNIFFQLSLMKINK